MTKLKLALFSLLLPMFTIAFLTGCSGVSGGLSPLSNTAANSDYRLAEGDKIRLTVYGLDPVNNEYVVPASGSLSLPIVEQVTARGRTLAELEEAIEARLAERQILNRPVVNVQLLTLRPFYVLGEVRTPGEYQYRPGTTVLAAISAAGGYTYRAKQRTVAITRNVDGRELTGTATEDAPVLPGDRIRVYEKWF